MRFCSILAGALCMGLAAEAQIQMGKVQEQEPNDSLNAPQVIATSLTSSQGIVITPAKIYPSGDRDYYRFHVGVSGVYSLRVDTNRDTVLTLYDGAGTLITSNDNDGNPDIPNQMASGLTLNLSAGDYIVEVRYFLPQGVCRYALRLFPGNQAPDYDPTEPNDNVDHAITLGTFSGGQLVSQVGFSTYGGGDVDVYSFKSASSITGLRIRTETYIDTVLRVTAPDRTVYENDDSSWDALNGLASEVYIPLGPAGTYFIEVRTFGVWGGYYRLRISAEPPSEIILQDGSAVFRLRNLRGARDRSPTNNADWLYGGVDHFFQQGWWYRFEGVHTREYAPATLSMVAQEEPNRAFLIYQEPDGLWLFLAYELRERTITGSTLECTLFAYNLRSTPATLHLFHYFDMDVGGATTNYAEWRGGRIWTLGTGNHYAYITPLVPFTHWEVTPYPQTLNRLLDSSPTNLMNGTLPFEGDVTGAFQWRALLNPWHQVGVRTHYALNTDTPPLQGDVNRDGCVDDNDTLAVLFAFGREGIFLPEDVNLNGLVDDNDLLTVLFQFGAGC
ncbi:MAG: DVUA0089 family protein [Fimbriimonadales bacterium]|nr:DVUA0089 family protein [Fimbriimonadales bacterium]